MSQNTKEYALFAPAVMEVERVYASAPAMCAVGCRKALELAVKWVYSADNTMQMPYKDNLQSLIHEPSFRFSVDYNTWGKLPFIVKRDIVIMSCLERMAALWRWWKRSAPARSECWSETGYAVCGLFRAEVWPQTDDVYDEWI